MKVNERYYFDRFLSRLGRYFPERAKVLDVGCREGDDAVLLQERCQCQVTAVDIEEHQREWKVRANKDLSFVKASAEKLPFADASFDAVWVKDALHHMDDPLQAMRELTRVSKPGAPVVIIEANRYNPVLYVHMTLMEGHEHFSRRKFRALLHQVDPTFSYFMMESRCLPWTAQWIWRLFEPAQNMLEALKVLNPWLTYQVAVVQGQGGKKKRKLSKKPIKLKV
ncbi:class I SAM-dependent methyltransferase [bacterium]|nr:class I SAM-dependent methyltransferase [bacterium]